MEQFLLWIGAYNVFGALVLPLFLRASIAERVLVTWLQVVRPPYAHGDHGPMWIWWSSMSNAGLGAIMVLASRWPVDVQRGVTAVAVAVYAWGVVLAVFATRSPRYRAYGVWACVVLWLAQITWGVIGFLRAS